MVKQYTIEPAYSRNDKITTYVDGVNNGYTIMSEWETPGYCERLEEEGFTRAYDLDKLREKVIEAKEAYELAQRILADASKSPLLKL